MNVWIMNLKDNREEKPADLLQSKFAFCKERGIVGIGWAKMDSDTPEDAAYAQAKAAMDSMEVGDLIWVKDPSAVDDTGKYYICRVLEKAVDTDDEIMHRYDIGKYCVCEYLPVPELPKAFDGERLTAIHTIEKANDTVADKTVDYLTPKKSKKRISKVKIGIISGFCALTLALGILFAPRIISTISEKTHPILPGGLTFGMTFDEIKNTTDFLSDGINSNPDSFEKSYDPFKRNYHLMIFSEQEKELFKKSLSLEFEVIPSFSFNDNKQLYEVSYTITGEESEDKDEIFDKLCSYYEKAFGDIVIDCDSVLTSLKVATCSNGDITCTFNNTFSTVTIESAEYAPKIPEISKDSIVDAFTSINYEVGMFSESLYSLLVRCVSNMESTYCNAYDAAAKHALIDYDDLEDLKTEKYRDYAATSYVFFVHGDICKNPDLPYLKNQDVDVIKVLLILDDYGKLQAYKVLEECSDLRTYATLTMYR